MNAGDEKTVTNELQNILNKLAPDRFTCGERKNNGSSVIGKPVDLQICFATQPKHAVLAVEVANVNTTQLVGEVCRLYYDECPLKLLILGDRNVPDNGKQQCEDLLAKLYGQNNIKNTPARVESYKDDSAIETALKDLLLLS